MSRILSIQTGLPQPMPSEDMAQQQCISGFLKKSVSTPLWLGSTNLEGDGQADLRHHGGPHKAVCVYSAEHYPSWRTELNQLDLSSGDFGENFTVADLTEEDVCIGDVWSVGSATVQISQPRQPCWKLARRWNIKDLALRVQQTGRTGWYLRVLVEGSVRSGLSMSLLDRPAPEWTITAANRLMHVDRYNISDAARLAAVPSLSPRWQKTLNRRVLQNVQPDEQKRLTAPAPDSARHDS